MLSWLVQVCSCAIILGATPCWAQLTARDAVRARLSQEVFQGLRGWSEEDKRILLEAILEGVPTDGAVPQAVSDRLVEEAKKEARGSPPSRLAGPAREYRVADLSWRVRKFLERDGATGQAAEQVGAQLHELQAELEALLKKAFPQLSGEAIHKAAGEADAPLTYLLSSPAFFPFASCPLSKEELASLRAELPKLVDTVAAEAKRAWQAGWKEPEETACSVVGDRLQQRWRDAVTRARGVPPELERLQQALIASQPQPEKDGYTDEFGASSELDRHEMERIGLLLFLEGFTVFPDLTGTGLPAGPADGGERRAASAPEAGS